MLPASIGWTPGAHARARGGRKGMLRTPLHSHAASTEADKPSSHCDHFLSSMSKPAQPKAPATDHMLLYLLRCLCVPLCVCALMKHVNGGGQRQVSSFLPICRPQGSNSGPRTWPVPLPAEPWRRPCAASESFKGRWSKFKCVVSKASSVSKISYKPWNVSVLLIIFSWITC